MKKEPPLDGRRKEAARNDLLILDAARAVFTARPEAPIATVAAVAGVGISALYRRFRSKEELLQRLCLEGLERHIEVAETALKDRSNPWESFRRFMTDIVEANTHALTLRVMGTFRPTEQLYGLATRAEQLDLKILKCARAAGVVRAGIEVDDLNLIFEQLAGIVIRGDERHLQLRRRYLALFLDGLRATDSAALPGPAPAWKEISGRWEP